MGKRRHFVAWAFQDWRTSRVRQRSIMRNDPAMRVVYLEVLFALCEAPDYRLPPEPADLEPIIGVPVEEVERVLPGLLHDGENGGRGGLVIEDGWLLNRRIIEDAQEEEAYRASLSRAGRKGGKRSAAAKIERRESPTATGASKPGSSQAQARLKHQESQAQAPRAGGGGGEGGGSFGSVDLLTDRGSDESSQSKLCEDFAGGEEQAPAPADQGGGLPPERLERLCKCGCGRPPKTARHEYAVPDECSKRYLANRDATSVRRHAETAKRVVAFYNRVTGRRATVKAQGAPVTWLLERGVKEEAIELAILGAMLLPYMIGENEDGRMYLDLETILRKSRYEGHADRARTATSSLVKDPVFAFWAQRHGETLYGMKKRIYACRDRLLEREGGKPLGPSAVYSDLKPEDPWP